MIPTDADLNGDGVVSAAERLVFWTVISLVSAITTALVVM